MVERFNGAISEIVNQTRFGSAAKLESTLHNDLTIDNNIPQRALEHHTGTQALKKWHEKSPHYSFVERVYNQAGLDR